MAESTGAHADAGLTGFRRWLPADAASRRRRSRMLFAAVPIALLMGAALVAYLYLTGPIRSGLIARGVHVDGVNLSMLSMREARQRLASELPSLTQSKVSATAGSRSLSVSAARLGAVWDVPAAVQQAFRVGRAGGGMEPLKELTLAAWHGRNFGAAVTVRRKTLLDALKPLACEVGVKARNAGISVEDNGDGFSFERIPAHDGVRLDLSGSARRIARAIATDPGQSQVTVSLPIDRFPPQINDQTLAPIDGEVAEYTTYYHPYQVDRSHNLWLASSAINGALILPGQVFSYNKRVGRRRISKGYRAAPIFLNGKVVDDTGGGVCQVATTVYNAALLSDCRIVERSPHSMRTSYSIPGRDATVAWGELDLKFRNTRKEPIILTTSMSGGALTVRVWGHRHPGERVHVYVVDGANRVTAYRTVSRPDGSVSRQIISSDPYPKAETRLVRR